LLGLVGKGSKIHFYIPPPPLKISDQIEDNYIQDYKICRFLLSTSKNQPM